MKEEVFANTENTLKLAVPKGPAKPRTNRPNVIVFFTDEQRWDTVGKNGNPLGLTPNFDRAASLGTHIVNSFTVQPVCGPSRACSQTGLYATQSGCYRNGIPLDGGFPHSRRVFAEQATQRAM